MWKLRIRMGPLFLLQTPIFQNSFSLPQGHVDLIFWKILKFLDPAKHVCAITGLPSKYFDPLTQSPYATIEAFKVLRERYKQQKRQLEEELEKRRQEEEVEEGQSDTRLESQIRQSVEERKFPSQEQAPLSDNTEGDQNDSRRYNTRTRTPRSYSDFQ